MIIAQRDPHDLNLSLGSVTSNEATTEPASVPSPRSVALLAGGYFIAAGLSLLSTRISGNIAYCWMATALLMPYLARLPLQRWTSPLTACAIVGAVASVVFGAGPQWGVQLALLSVSEATIGALLLRRFHLSGQYFEDVPCFVRYAMLIGVLLPVLTAFGGAALSDLAFATPFWAGWLAWYMVHALGAMTFTPLVVLLLEEARSRRIADFHPRHGGTANLAIVIATAVVTTVVFAQSKLPLLFLPLFPLTLLTFRAGRLGAALGVCIVAVIGGALTLLGHGPATLVTDDQTVSVLFFQFYLTVTIMTLLPMAAELNRRKALHRKLADSEAMYQLMANRSGDVLMNLDVDGRIRYCSPAIARYGNFDPSQLVGQNSLRLVAKEDRAEASAGHLRALAQPNETFVYSYRVATPHDDEIWFESHARAIVDEEGCVTGVVSAARDITQRKQAEANLIDIANSDPMTKLSNRRRFDELLASAVGSSDQNHSSGCLGIIDIDFFKNVNDMHGHLAGDDVIKAVAARLRPMLRSTDFIARIGGEEFGLILWGLRLEDADRMCERLRENIATQRIAVGANHVSVTVSVGIAELSGHNSPSALFAAADAALYRAKAEGRNCVRLAA